jgi:hypothetical protein
MKARMMPSRVITEMDAKSFMKGREMRISKEVPIFWPWLIHRLCPCHPDWPKGAVLGIHPEPWRASPSCA